MNEKEFDRWIKAGHYMFEIFEARYDAYPLVNKWVSEWFLRNKFKVTTEQLEKLKLLLKNFEYKAFKVSNKQQERIKKQLEAFIEKGLIGETSDIGWAISPYLFTWNFRRFKEYFTKKDGFQVMDYFKELDGFFKKNKEKFLPFRQKILINNEEVDEDPIREIFKEVGGVLRELGINNNEPVGTIKLLHIFAPHYFPLLDNPIRDSVERSKKGQISIDYYLEWMKRLKSWIIKYKETANNLEQCFGLSILKLVDEALYVMCSVKLSHRVGQLGL